MSAVTSRDVLRRGPTGFRGWASRQVMAALPFGLRVLRRVWPIAHFRKTYVVTLHFGSARGHSVDRQGVVIATY